MNLQSLKPAGSFAHRLGVKSIVYGPPGCGKCLGRGTEILMFNGTIKYVEDVKVGDKLMGPDSKPRNVLRLARGIDNMYEIVPVKGDSYVVNGPHILSLKFSGEKDKVHNVKLTDFLQYPEWEQKRFKCWRTAVDFPYRSVDIDPYLVGIWLGDGDTDRVAFHTIDNEISDFLKSEAILYGIQITEYRQPGKCPRYSFSKGTKLGGSNPVTDAFNEYGLLGNKHVPHWYKVNSKEIRLQVLAGLLDTDGSLSNGGFDFISKLEQLADDVCFLARSLGLAAYKKKCRKTCVNNGITGEYFRVGISGDCSVIPTKISRKKAEPRKQIKDVLLTGFEIDPIGKDEYFGFELDGDKLFVLGDFTVTHNTPIINTAPNPVLLACEPGLLSMRGSSVPTFEAYNHTAVAEFFTWFFSSAEAKKFDTLAIDSVSQMAEIILTHELQANKDGRKAYGEMSRKVMEYMNKLYFMPEKHLYLIAKQSIVEEAGTNKRKPYFPGQDLNVKVPHLFDVIMHFGLHNIPGVVGAQKAFCTTEQFDLLARDRSGRLNTYEPPNLTDIFNKAMQ